MSFSTEVKEELEKKIPTGRHCQIAEIAAMIQYGDVLLPKYFTLLERAFPIKTDWNEVSDEEIFAAIKCPSGITKEELEATIVNPILLKSICCRRSFLRGVFLTAGSMSNPEKNYHLEFVCSTMQQAKQVQDVILSFEVDAKIIQRKKYYVVYLKEGEGIVELLNIMGAHISLMNFENFRILKEMRNDINRRVNCEAANITKTVNAASKQIEDIEYIQEHYGLQKLSSSLRSIAEVRLEYPEATLKELGEYLDPVVGKSGVNHRLKKLSELADKLRG